MNKENEQNTNLEEEVPKDASPQENNTEKIKKEEAPKNAQAILQEIHTENLKKNNPDETQKIENFSVGDTVEVQVKITEGKTTRLQAFTGTVISKDSSGISETFTVRRVTGGFGVEKVFVLNSPQLESIKVKRKGKVRRAKLYYLRDKVGKSAKIKRKL